MELDGFKLTTETTAAGERIANYRPLGQTMGRHLRLRVNTDGNLIVEYIEGKAVPGVTLGERVTSPVHSDELEWRLLKVMAVHNFNASWLMDGHTEIDIEMVSRGYEVGKLVSGELIWFRREHGSTFVVKREESDQLPSAFDQAARLVVVGITRKELVVKTLDYRSLISFMESNSHYDLYQPQVDIHIPGLYLPDFITFH
jgi:hypothetical protein